MVATCSPRHLPRTHVRYPPIVCDKAKGVPMRGYYDDKEDILKRLRRIEGQVRGLQRMVENDEYCIDILTQITAASNALKKVAVVLLEDHLGHCMKEGRHAGKDMVSEATAAIERLVKA
jgi:DNA-binding FrmR family transcriptional regulator